MFHSAQVDQRVFRSRNKTQVIYQVPITLCCKPVTDTGKKNLGQNKMRKRERKKKYLRIKMQREKRKKKIMTITDNNNANIVWI